MEYATPINDMYMKHVAYDQTNDDTNELFSPENIKLISKKVTQLLMGVDPQNRPIIVPDKTIGSVLSSVFGTFVPQNVGDINSRYILPCSDEHCSNNQAIIDQAIEIIVSDVRNNLGIEQCNKSLSIWDSVLGDFNRHGLMPHSQIKINHNKLPTQFNMMY